MDARFSAKCVLVAGGTRGLGRAVTLSFLDESANVVVTYRRQEEFVALSKAAGTNALSLEGHQVDVTDETEVRRLTEESGPSPRTLRASSFFFAARRLDSFTGQRYRYMVICKENWPRITRITQISIRSIDVIRS